MKWKDKKLWLCALLYAAAVLIWSGCMGGWGDPRGGGYVRAIPELLIPLVWMVGLYWKWSGNWTGEDNLPWAVLLALVTLPYLPLAIVGYGTWLCPIGSVVMGIACIAVKKKCG